jgi:hypothetical protein
VVQYPADQNISVGSFPSFLTVSSAALN